MKFTVNLGVHSYDVILKRGCLQNAYQFIHLGRKVAVITDDGVPARYAQLIADQCAEARVLTVKQGQASKNLRTIETLLNEMLDFGMGKGDLVVAVGGGTVGNLAGFAASLYMQGIEFMNCPTTTLSMMNRAVGGTVSVDLNRTRNVIGSAYHPRVVLVDPDTLQTLPCRHYANGLAEALKLALCLDPTLYDLLESSDVNAQIETIIQRCLTAQRTLAEQAQEQPDAAQVLNFGHTLGNGIEGLKGNWGRRTTGLYHGECVALGMLPMIENRGLQKRTRAVLRRLGLPTRCALDKEALWAEIQHQNRAGDDVYHLIRVPGLGCWQAETATADQLRTLVCDK